MSAVNLYDNDTLTWRHDGKLYLLHVRRDEDAESPREDDNLAIMACWHRRYSLGDKLDDKDSGAFWQRMVREYVPHTDVINAARNGKLTGIRLAENPDDKQRIDVYESVPWETCGDEPQEYLEHEGVDSQYLFDILLDDLTNVQCQTLLRPYAVWLPLWLYDHSGLTISCGERVYPYNDRWDSGCLGWIIVPKAVLLRETDATSDTWRERGYEILRGEVEEYDQYLRGEVYGYTLYESDIPEDGEAPDWTETDNSCWGFFGSDIEKSGIADNVGCGLSDAIQSGAYQTGVATQHRSYYYTFA